MARRLRVAFFSPIPPVRSGIADYSDELLPDLAKFIDVDVIVDQPIPRGSDSDSPVRTRTVQEYKSGGVVYDLNIYQVGNNVRHHGFMLPIVDRVPGVLVLHDYCLNYLMLGVTLARGDREGLERTLQPRYGQSARRLTWELLLNRRDPLTLSFAGRLIQQSSMVLVHSQYARDKVLTDHPAAEVRVVPMGIRPSPAPAPARVAALRARFGLDDNDLVVTSASTAAHNKRLDLLVRAFRRASGAVQKAKLLILGAGLLQQPVSTEIERDPNRRVVHTGWLSAEDYRDLIALSDFVVDLRYPAAAETSASLLRALVAGKPAILTEQGPFAEVPSSCCIRVPVGINEEAAVGNAIAALAGDVSLRQSMGDAAARFGVERCSTGASAASYAECVAECLRLRTRSSIDVPVKAPSPGARVVLSGVYKACKVGQLWRTYGASTALRRIREEIRDHA